MNTGFEARQIDDSNAEFWNELCGTNLAQVLGLTEHSPESLKKYDEAYLGFYPYLSRYVASENLAGKRVLEIGLGYGTLGQVLASLGSHYYGLDIAENPVAIMRYRLSLLGEGSLERRVRRGSALDMPFEDNSFDYVYSIGCLHHTGDLPKAVSEVHRVLAPQGKALVMLYNKHSWRQLKARFWLSGVRAAWGGRGPVEHPGFWAQMRTWYDGNTEGEAPPHTDYVSRAEARRLFGAFRHVSIESQNLDHIARNGRIIVKRERLLNTVGRVLGLDLYIRVEK
jgi:SAM-dependent methyltransferase